MSDVVSAVPRPEPTTYERLSRLSGKREAAGLTERRTPSAERRFSLVPSTLPMSMTLLEKVWDAHTVRKLPNGQTQLFVGLHLVHEVTSPQAFDMLRVRGWRVRYPGRTIATVDHIVPTRDQRRPFMDVHGRGHAVGPRAQLPRRRRAAPRPQQRVQGIVHVIGPELGLTQPGMTIACGDSHTSTHGAFGAVAFGIGTSQVRDVLASQCLALEPLKVRRIEVNGALARGVYAKDVILEIIRRLGRERRRRASRTSTPATSSIACRWTSA